MAYPPLKSRSSFIAWAGVFFFLAIAVFSQIRHFGFLIYDDPLFVSENPFIRGGLTWKNIQWAFSADLFFQTRHVDYWQPITVLARIVEMQLFGLNAGGYHLVSLILHLTNTILLFYFLGKLTDSIWKAGLVSAIFLVHPLQVTSVAWITEQKGLLSSFFGLLALNQYVNRADGNSFRKNFLVFFWFALSLMSKPLLVMLPAVLLLLDFWPLKRFVGSVSDKKSVVFKAVSEKWPLFLLSFTSYAITWFCSPRRIFAEPVKRIHAINAFTNYIKYIINFINPNRLFVIYPYQYSAYPAWMIALSIFALVFVSAYAIRRTKKYPYLAVGWFWFVIFLLPFAWLIRLENRFMYFPMMGFLIILACGMGEVSQGRKWQQLFFVLFYSAITVCCALKSYEEIAFWQSDIKLFAHAYDLLPNDKQANQLYAVALANQGKAENARYHFLKTLEHSSKDALIYNNIASVYLDNGKVDESITYYKKAIETKPDYAVGYNNLCDAYREARDYDQAISYCKKAMALAPALPSPYIILARVMKAKTLNAEALQWYTKTIQIEPNFAEAYHERGILLAQAGNIPKAIADFETALRINPDNSNFCSSMAHALSIEGKLDRANYFYEKALAIDPGNAQIHNNMANNLTKMKLYQEAIRHYEEAIHDEPTYVEAYNNLGATLMETGDLKKAAGYFEHAIRLNPGYLSAKKNLERITKNKD